MGLILLALAAQNGPPQAEIDKAVARGIAFLQGELKSAAPFNPLQEELVLAALVYGGLPEKDPNVQGLLKKVLDKPCHATYQPAVLTIALEKLDPNYYFWKLLECGQHLVSSQCVNGCWGYSSGAPASADMKKKIQELKEWGERVRKGQRSARPRIALEAGPSKSPHGDNSNAQFAALGLWVCAQVGIEIPQETLKLGAEYWIRQQDADGGWRYYDPNGPRGQTNEPNVNMTAGGVSSVLILQGIVENSTTRGKPLKDPRAKGAVDKGLKWLDKNWTFHPKGTLFMSGGYSHYSIERAGIIGDLAKIGSHAWYAEGAKDLLASQEKDGAWRLTKKGPSGGKIPMNWPLIDTCFAILFFKKSVTPVIPTER
jgi:hypothetical protein